MTLEERIEKVESELKRTKHQRHLAWGVAAAVTVLTVTMFYPQGKVAAQGNTAEEIRARRIVLLDESGKTRTVLGADRDKPGLYLYDENGKTRAGLTMNTDGESGLFLSDRNDSSRIALIVGDDGTPTLSLRGQDKKSRIGLIVYKDGTPELDLLDENGHLRAILGAHKDKPGLRLYDENGKPYWSTPSQDDGR